MISSFLHQKGPLGPCTPPPDAIVSHIGGDYLAVYPNTFLVTIWAHNVEIYHLPGLTTPCATFHSDGLLKVTRTGVVVTEVTHRESPGDGPTLLISLSDAYSGTCLATLTAPNLVSKGY
ncbi:hypothetical protein Pelo_19242 [Pelomyxa schiedti]|nr:hypothetical protein Pelo_19242 [Pelomyxa schiedti]